MDRRRARLAVALGTVAAMLAAAYLLGIPVGRWIKMEQDLGQHWSLHPSRVLVGLIFGALGFGCCVLMWFAACAIIVGIADSAWADTLLRWITREKPKPSTDWIHDDLRALRDMERRIFDEAPYTPPAKPAPPQLEDLLTDLEDRRPKAV